MPSKGSGVQEDAFLAAVIEANNSPMNIDWYKVASLIGYGSAKSASTRFGIIRKRWNSTKPNKPAHVGVYAGKVSKTRAPAKGTANRASRANPVTFTKKSLNGKESLGDKEKKLLQKVEGGDGDEESGQEEEVKDFMAPSDNDQQEADYNASEGAKPARDFMSPSDEEEEQEQESFQSQVNRGLYSESNAGDDEGNLSDGAVELLNSQIAQQQEAQLQAQMHQQMAQRSAYKENNAYEPAAAYQNAQDEGRYHAHMAQDVSTYYN